MKSRFLSLVGLLVMGAFTPLYGCESGTDSYPITQIRFYVEDSLYDAVIVRSDYFIMPNAPQKEGYEFVGWYCDKAFTTEFKADKYAGDRSRYDIDVYAKFELNSSDITNNPSIHQVLCQT